MDSQVSFYQFWSLIHWKILDKNPLSAISDEAQKKKGGKGEGLKREHVLTRMANV